MDVQLDKLKGLLSNYSIKDLYGGFLSYLSQNCNAKSTAFSIKIGEGVSCVHETVENEIVQSFNVYIRMLYYM